MVVSSVTLLVPKTFAYSFFGRGIAKILGALMYFFFIFMFSLCEHLIIITKKVLMQEKTMITEKRKLVCLILVFKAGYARKNTQITVYKNIKLSKM